MKKESKIVVSIQILKDIYQDAKTLKEANQAADTLTDEEYQSVLENYPALQDRMIQLGSGKL